ncbi:hypothetical protein G7078_01995 [Sphingomonas sinipercae]|uniref:DUF885 domain-containing protein n=2 Tax=Sphingomonas sinipercae TaxID=2714944 RepID=A0A6G7ZQQ6_9SPHN|nr:hypothetical protein G7078_01995 [Sphingomonas sinipercae]
MMMRWTLGATALSLGACAQLPPALVAAPQPPAPLPAPADTLDAAARDYVVLQLAIGEKEAGYIDAYYGPAEYQARGREIAAARNLAQLKADVDELSARVAKLSATDDPALARRGRYLLGNLTAAKTRLRMMAGEKLSFADEAEGLFGVRPVLKPLSAYDPILAKVETLVPGKGPLWKRVDSFADRFIIPADRLKPVMDAAIAGCKARTLRHIALPAGERFDLALVTGKSWGGYNYYQGNYHSKIEINTDLPARMSRAVDLGCHEGYPGHHVLNALMERELTRGRGWIEYSLYPLYSPQSLIAEGSANYGIHLAFPGSEKVAFETATLYPLAGLSSADAARYDQLGTATEGLRGASITIQRDYLEQRIGEEQAVKLLQHYGLQSEERARKAISFAKQYRSYVINYGLGQDMIRQDVESYPPAARWKRFEQIISEPTLPSDLRAAQ